MKLDFKANTPDAADSLISYAQPFGAKSINLSVNVSGQAKDGGYVNFAAGNLRHNSAIKPIDFAKRLLRGALGLTFGGSWPHRHCVYVAMIVPCLATLVTRR